jgi:hypothetical protein
MKPVKSVLITQKNYPWVYSRLDRLFKHKKIMVLHSFECGMKRRLKPKCTKEWGHLDKWHMYDNVKTEKVKFIGDVYPRYYVDLDDHSVTTIIIGDSVCFLGNRIIVKRIDYPYSFPAIGYKGPAVHSYTCYQIDKEVPKCIG